MKTAKKFGLILIAFTVILNSCKVKVNDVNMPKWQSNIFGPLVRTNTEINQIVQLKNITASATVNTAAIGYPPGTYPSIPPITNLNIAPTPFISLTSFKSLTLLSGSLSYNIINAMPINIKAGAVLMVENASNNSIIFTDTIRTDIPALNGNYSPAIPIDLSGKTIEDSLILKINNFGSDGSVTALTISSNEFITLKLTLQNLSILQFTVVQSDSVSIKDTAQFTLNGYKIHTDVVGGTLTFYITNGFPLNMGLQFYFLDNTNKLLDSLFDGAQNTLNSCPIDANGYSNGYSQDSLIVNINTNKLDHMKQASYIVTSLKSNVLPRPQGITIRNTDSLKVLIVGDLLVDLN